MLPTPSTSHVNYDHIYEPAEDSFLLLDTLSSPAETSFLQARFGTQKPLHDATNSGPHILSPNHSPSSPSPLVLEVGTGSGIVLAFVTANARTIFGRADILALGTDVNEFACLAARRTVREEAQTAAGQSGHEKPDPQQEEQQGKLLATVNADLVTPIRDGTVDVLIFNPPYVPTPSVPGSSESRNTKDETGDAFDRNSRLLELSYAGGNDGMEVTDRLLGELPRVLSAERGVAYVLLCRQNKPDEVVERVKAWGEALTAQIVGASGKTAGWEKLVIVRIARG